MVFFPVFLNKTYANNAANKCAPTAIVPLPIAVPISCNSLIESDTDKATANCNNNKSYNNIENDRPDDDDDNNNNNDDVDCFFWQDKQPVLPQLDILPTNISRPSLIESPTDTSLDDDTTSNDDDSTVIHKNCYYDDDASNNGTYINYAYDSLDKYSDYAYGDNDDDDDNNDSHASSYSVMKKTIITLT